MANHTAWLSQPTVTTLNRSKLRLYHSTTRLHEEKKPAEAEAEAEPETPVKSIPYSELTIGVPTEVFPGERRVAMTPANAALLLKKGFKRVMVEHGAGFAGQFPIHDY